jgi:hypothetical protein
MELKTGLRQPPKLQAFIGKRPLSRQILPTKGPKAFFQGMAHWHEVSPHKLMYHEAGWLELADQKPIWATRSYVWEDGANGPRVFFADGRFFHDIPQSGVMAFHDCPPDMYHVTYDFSAWPRFQTIWDVRGPRKEYRIINDYDAAVAE